MDSGRAEADWPAAADGRLQRRLTDGPDRTGEGAQVQGGGTRRGFGDAIHAVRDGVRCLATPPSRGPKQYFHALDLVRGCAALAILIWHYQHFYFQGTINPIVYSKQVQPLYGPLWLLYERGYFAVELFWVISGFVFASVYAGSTISGRAFFIQRFARLYPLHFATLLIVAALQAANHALAGGFRLFEFNDAWHFGLNLLFISHWGLESGDSYNGPIWSVSIEVFIYIVFWLSLGRIFKLGMVGPLAMAAMCTLLLFAGVPLPFWECGIFFFAGAAAYVWLAQMWTRNAWNFGAGAFALVGGWALLLSDVPHSGLVARVALFCGIVLLAGAVDVMDKARRAARFSLLGDMTYSLYLLHVPVQLAILLAMSQMGIDRRIVASPWFLFGFVALMLVVAVSSYRYFELPMRNWVRQQLAGTSKRRSREAEGSTAAAG